MRGTDKRGGKRTGHTRITPAHAGNRYVSEGLDVAEQDHPRSCGEQLSMEMFFTQMARITPAHAGNRQSEGFPVCDGGDHPRSCGEQNGFCPYGMGTKGSPPLMRGTAAQQDISQLMGRITPAHAGNS